MKAASLQQLIEASDRLVEENRLRELGLVFACQNKVYCAEKGNQVLVAELSSPVLALAHNAGVLYAGGDFGVKNLIDGKDISSRAVYALASHGGALYGGCGDRHYRPSDIDFYHSSCGQVYCILNDYKTADIPEGISALASHDGRLYAAGHTQMYDALTGKMLPLAPHPIYTFDKKDHVRHGLVLGLASHKDSLYCTNYFRGVDPGGTVVDIFNKKILVEQDFEEFNKIASVNDHLYYASAPGISDVFDTQCNIPTGSYVTAMTGVPMPLWQEFAKKGRVMAK